MQVLAKQMETNRLATQDNFAQLLATDNYLEKYLQFKIQSMISQSLASALDDGQMKLYQKFEEDAFKAFHR